MKDAADGPDVCLAADFLVQKSLRRHVIDGIGGFHFWEAKVSNFYLAGLKDEQVFWSDIVVDYWFFVGVLQPFAYLLESVNYLLFRHEVIQILIIFHLMSKTTKVAVLHDEDDLSFILETFDEIDRIRYVYRFEIG